MSADTESVTAPEGTTATATGTVSDPDGNLTNLSASVGEVRSDGNGTWTWSYTTSDGPEQSQSINITATDSTGATDTATFDLQVQNAAPSVSATRQAVTVNEGDTATITGTVTDPGNDTLTLNSSVGTVTTDGDGSWKWTYRTTDGPDQSQSVTITAIDEDGASNRTAVNLTVRNVAPNVSLDLPATGLEGTPVPLKASLSDPGADTHTATVDWGDGSVVSPPVNQTADSISPSHIYATGGRFTVGVTITDDDGAATTVTDTVTVTHVVEMDVKPGNGDATDPINPNSQGVVPVVVETTDEFDASTIAVDTLRFGAPDTVAAGGGATPVHDGHLEDVDNDGDHDLVVHFNESTGIDTDSDQATVAGLTTEDVPLTGSDDIKTVGRSQPDKGKGEKSKQGQDN